MIVCKFFILLHFRVAKTVFSMQRSAYLFPRSTFFVEPHAALDSITMSTNTIVKDLDSMSYMSVNHARHTADGLH